MAGSELTSTLTIIDKSSAVLETIAKAAEKATEQFQKLVDSLEGIGEIHFGIEQSSFNNTVSAIHQIEEDISRLCDSPHDINFDVHPPNVPPDPPDDDDDDDDDDDNDRQRQRETQRGLGNIIDVCNKLYGTFGLIMGAIDTITSMMRRVDKNIQQTARFEQLAKGEGYEGKDIAARGKQMRNVAFERAQEIGVDVTTFNDQLMSFANNAAFTSFEEATDFATMLNKMFIASGTSADAASGAITQLLQGLSKGKLQGEDLMSILSNAPEVGGLLEAAYARMNNIPVDKVKGKVRDLAGDGQLKADVIKEAILGASEDIESKFNAMPLTFETAMTRIKNAMGEMLQPLYKALTDFANSEEFKVFMDSFLKISKTILNVIIPAITSAIAVVSPIFAKIAAFTSDNLPSIIDFFVSILEKAKYIFAALGGCIAFTWAWNTAVTAVNAVLTAISQHPILAIAVGTAMIIGFILKMQEEVEWVYGLCTKFGLIVSMLGHTIFMAVVKIFTYIGNGATKVAQFLVGIVSSLIGGVIDSVVSGWNWLMEKIGASDLTIETSIGQDVFKFGAEQLGNSFSDDDFFNTEALEKDYMERNFNAWEDMGKSGRELGWKPPKTTDKTDETLEVLRKIEKGTNQNTKNTGNIDRNTRSVSIDKDSILFMKEMATAEVINRYNTFSPNITQSFNSNRPFEAGEIETLSGSAIDGAMNGMRTAI